MKITYFTLTPRGWYFGGSLFVYPSKASAFRNARKLGYTHYTQGRMLSTIIKIPAKYG